MELGISSWLWEDRMSVLDAIPLVASYEIRNIEVKMRTPPHCDYKDSEYMRCLADLLGKHGVTITHVHPGTSNYEVSAFSDAKSLPKVPSESTLSRRETLRNLKSWVDTFIGFGRPVLSLHPSGLFSIQEHELRLRSCKESLKAIVGYCQERGVKLAIENMLPARLHPPGPGIDRLAQTLDEYFEIIDSVGSDSLGALLDIGHANITEGMTVEEFIGLLGDRLFILHANDSHGLRDEHLMPGQGNIDWPRAVEALGDIGYRGVFMLEIRRRAEVEKHLEEALRIGDRDLQ